ncbi:hypothetical protein PTET_a1548 [Pseudoalteromonas tetraodonis]|nr:hypothetical protein PTET_a1548 [Pseudoalteromonas tetraodonis]
MNLLQKIILLKSNYYIHQWLIFGLIVAVTITLITTQRIKQ